MVPRSGSVLARVHSVLIVHNTFDIPLLNTKPHLSIEKQGFIQPITTSWLNRSLTI
jgi:hypothetical protein